MTYNPFSLSGKTVLITGAASGIGRATAIECCRMGAEVIITDINPDGLEETFRQLPEQNGTHIRIVADLTKEEEIESLADRLPRLDGCVNNAGIMKLVLTPFLTTEIIERIQKINLIAPMMLTRNLIKKEENEESFIHCFYSLCRRSIQGIRRQRYLCHDQMRNRCLYENNCVGIRR